jgi:hypothetical protein
MAMPSVSRMHDAMMFMLTGLAYQLQPSACLPLIPGCTCNVVSELRGGETCTLHPASREETPHVVRCHVMCKGGCSHPNATPVTCWLAVALHSICLLVCPSNYALCMGCHFCCGEGWSVADCVCDATKLGMQVQPGTTHCLADAA